MSDLSRSLVDAAARAVESTIVANCPPNIMPTLPPGSGPQDLARGAVAAVLETLEADLVANVAACRNARCAHCERAAVAIADFRRLAAEVKEERP